LVQYNLYFNNNILKIDGSGIEEVMNCILKIFAEDLKKELEEYEKLIQTKNLTKNQLNEIIETADEIIKDEDIKECFPELHKLAKKVKQIAESKTKSS